MRVVRDRWGDKWVRHWHPQLTVHRPFHWTNPGHVFAYARQLGRVPEVQVDG